METDGNVHLWQDSYPEALVGLPEGLTVGPDGNLWFTDNSNPATISRITVFGEVAKYVLSPDLKVEAITVGPDGALWFTESGEAPSHPPDAIGRITTEGEVMTFPLPTQGTYPTDITAGPDGALWFTQRVGHEIGRITTTGQIQEFPIPGGLSPGTRSRPRRTGALSFTGGKGCGGDHDWGERSRCGPCRTRSS